MRQIKYAFTLLALSLSFSSTTILAAPQKLAKSDPVVIKLLGINDFHGQITAGRVVKGRPIGGAAVLAAYLHNEEKGVSSNTVITMMGDQVGASVPASGLLDHQPSILFLDSLANAACSSKYRMEPKCNMVATIGNHEFDKGKDSLFDLIYGTNKPPKNGWISLPRYPGTSFPYVSANIVDEKTGKPLVPPYVIKDVNGVQVAFIGAILKNAASSMLPANAKGLKFLDEAEAINSYIPEIRSKGVNIIVAIMHQGGDSYMYEGDTRDGTKVHGTINDVVAKLKDGVDVVMAGHTHRFLNAYLPNSVGHKVLVTQANSYSTAFAEVTLQVDRKTKSVISKTARIISTFADQFPGTIPDPTAAYIVQKAKDSVAPVVNAHVGSLQDDLSRIGNESGESTLGNLVADAFKYGMKADIAFTNSTSIRTNLKAGEVTWGDLYSMQPFANPIVKMTFKGCDILDLLEQQWKTAYKNILQVSGLTYQYDESRPVDYRVTGVMVNGQPIELNKTYTVAVNSFLANGGSGFSVMKRGKVTEHGATDLEMLVSYIKTLPEPFTSSIEGRIQGRVVS